MNSTHKKSMTILDASISQQQAPAALGSRVGMLARSAFLFVLATSMTHATAAEPSLSMTKEAALKYLKDEDIYPAPSNMMRLAMSADYRAITAMIAAGIDPNHKPEAGHTALRMATSFACSDDPTPEQIADIGKTVKVLIDAKANVNEIDASGLGALMMTAQKCPGSITKLLLDAGADANQRSPQGFTPLSMALVVENFSSADVLIRAGVRISAAAAKRLLDDAPSAQLKAYVARATAPGAAPAK